MKKMLVKHHSLNSTGFGFHVVYEKRKTAGETPAPAIAMANRRPPRVKCDWTNTQVRVFAH